MWNCVSLIWLSGSVMFTCTDFCKYSFFFVVFSLPPLFLPPPSLHSSLHTWHWNERRLCSKRCSQHFYCTHAKRAEASPRWSWCQRSIPVLGWSGVQNVCWSVSECWVGHGTTVGPRRLDGVQRREWIPQRMIKPLQTPYVGSFNLLVYLAELKRNSTSGKHVFVKITPTEGPFPCLFDTI